MQQRMTATVTGNKNNKLNGVSPSFNPISCFVRLLGPHTTEFVRSSLLYVGKDHGIELQIALERNYCW
jgi:hypothetical protein